MSQEPFDLEKEAAKIIADELDDHIGAELKKMLRESIVAFGRRCADDALDRVAMIAANKFQEHVGFASDFDGGAARASRDIQDAIMLLKLAQHCEAAGILLDFKNGEKLGESIRSLKKEKLAR